ncbi:MAG: hypothetical protein ACE5GV_13700 [Candidatus Scalindua sp.]
MGDLLKKLDEIMTSDQVRKLGGLFCLVTLVITAAAFLIGAGSILKTMKGPEVAVEATGEETSVEATDEGTSTEAEAADEDNEEETADDETEEAEK